MITEQQLRQIMPNLGMQKLQLYLPHLNAAMQSYGVNSLQRTAAFVAQLAHESAEFRFMEELWGPIPAQVRYEPQCELARRLGNTQPGDGKRFKGRGPIQITGRFNYQKYGDLLAVNIVSRPELAAQPEVAFSTAGLFWKTNGLNELADAGNFVAITRRINGGTNGLADREKYHARALQVLSVGFVAAPPVGASRGGLRRAGAVKIPSEPLLRGYEAIMGLPESAASDFGQVLESFATAQARDKSLRGTAAPTKPSSRRAPVKKATGKKAARKNALTKNAPVNKAPSKKAAAKKLSAKNTLAKKAISTRALAKKTTAANTPKKSLAVKKPSTAAPKRKAAKKRRSTAEPN